MDWIRYFSIQFLQGTISLCAQKLLQISFHNTEEFISTLAQMVGIRKNASLFIFAYISFKNNNMSI